MTFPFDAREMENGSYRDASDVGERKTKKAVQVENSPQEPVVVTTTVMWDKLQVSFPSANQEIYTYKKNSVTVMTVVITYENDSKKTIVDIDKTIF